MHVEYQFTKDAMNSRMLKLEGKNKAVEAATYHLKDPNKTDPEQRAVQKFKVFLTFPVTTCVQRLPSAVTVPLRSSITYTQDERNSKRDP